MDSEVFVGKTLVNVWQFQLDSGYDDVGGGRYNSLKTVILFLRLRTEILFSCLNVIFRTGCLLRIEASFFNSGLRHHFRTEASLLN